MTNTVTISCILNTTNPSAELGFEAWIDNTKFVDIDHVTEEKQISMEIPDDDSEHELRFILKNKTAEHTQVDEAGNIISDSTLAITDLAFDEIKLGYIATALTVYTHDFNGTAEESQHKFYSEMGCNGTVNLKFTTPLYLWLLENM
jgi:hypothetical protein